jgi:hypothetical protein
MSDEFFLQTLTRRAQLTVLFVPSPENPRAKIARAISTLWRQHLPVSAFPPLRSLPERLRGISLTATRFLLSQNHHPQEILDHVTFMAITPRLFAFAAGSASSFESAVARKH